MFLGGKNCVECMYGTLSKARVGMEGYFKVAPRIFLGVSRPAGLGLEMGPRRQRSVEDLLQWSLCLKDSGGPSSARGYLF